MQGDRGPCYNPQVRDAQVRLGFSWPQAGCIQFASLGYFRPANGDFCSRVFGEAVALLVVGYNYGGN